MSTGQQIGEVDRIEERADPSSTLTQHKQPRVPKKIAPRKKVKVTKMFIDPIMLIEGDLFDIDETVCDVTKDALQEMMMEQNIVLGALNVEQQGLWV